MILTKVGGESPNLVSRCHPEVGQFVSFLLINTFHWKLREAPSPVRYALFLDRQLWLRKIPILGGKSIDLHDGMHFVADLISNCFFEVNNVNILCFLGFQSSIECKRYWMVSNNCCLVVILVSIMITVGSILSGEFNGKC